MSWPAISVRSTGARPWEVAHYYSEVSVLVQRLSPHWHLPFRILGTLTSRNALICYHCHVESTRGECSEVKLPLWRIYTELRLREMYSIQARHKRDESKSWLPTDVIGGRDVGSGQGAKAG